MVPPASDTSCKAWETGIVKPDTVLISFSQQGPSQRYNDLSATTAKKQNKTKQLAKQSKTR